VSGRFTRSPQDYDPYGRMRLSGDGALTAAARIDNSAKKKKCDVCGAKVFSKGLCNKHYQRQRRQGDGKCAHPGCGQFAALIVGAVTGRRPGKFCQMHYDAERTGRNGAKATAEIRQSEPVEWDGAAAVERLRGILAEVYGPG
jgi:hypothetical protein